MANLVSPGINVSEIDLTKIVPTLSTTVGALAGLFSWGPVGVRTLVTSESNLTQVFGIPTNNNYETFFTASNFLAYGNKLWIARAVDGAFNAFAPTTAAAANTSSNILVGNTDVYFSQFATSSYANVVYLANYPGSLGNALQVSVCDSPTAYSQLVSVSELNNIASINTPNVFSLSVTSTPGSAVLAVNVAGNAFSSNAASILNVVNFFANNILTTGDVVVVGNTTVGTQNLSVANAGVVTSGGNNSVGYWSSVNVNLTSPVLIPVSITQPSMQTYWQYYNQFAGAPGTSPYLTNLGYTAADQMHIVVTDPTGTVSGTPGAVLESWPFLSRATDAKGPLGNSIYYKNVLNYQSNYIFAGTIDRSGAASNTSATVVTSTNYNPYTFQFVGGVDGNAESNCSLTALTGAFNLFQSKQDVQIDLLLAGKSRGTTTPETSTPSTGANYSTLGNYLIGNIATARKDCVVFISPAKPDVVTASTPLTNVQAFYNNLATTSNYAVVDSGYKYQYDRYNDTYRWVPLNGDVAGCCVVTDTTRDPWVSPAGFTRGQIKNVIKLAFNPNQAQRDTLYSAYINSVVTFPGQGTVLYGDKTYQGFASAFDRINVRRLFITIERAISLAAQANLFEFNNSYTQAAFVNMLTPYLRDIQGRQGITSFLVVCDGTNNTPQVVDSNQFVGDIYIQPAKSINFIQLNFNAVRTGVQFSTIIGGQS